MQWISNTFAQRKYGVATTTGRQVGRLVTMLLAAALILAGCARPDDEEQIARNLAAIEEAVERKDFSAIEQYLHSSFVANEKMGVEEVGQLLRLYSLRHRRLGVTIVDSSTTMHADLPDRANSVVSVILTGSSGLLPSDGSIRRVDVEWVEQSGDWMIRKASWRQ
ncbi:MAG: hypothetical protein R3228_18465 [Halioglobus sp.]|nr:hypothetical protein [Halioglobus sp.]